MTRFLAEMGGRRLILFAVLAIAGAGFLPAHGSAPPHLTAGRARAAMVSVVPPSLRDGPESLAQKRLDSTRMRALLMIMVAGSPRK